MAGLNTFRFKESDVADNASGVGFNFNNALIFGRTTNLTTATPDLGGNAGLEYAVLYKFANGGATTVTNFVNGATGQFIVIIGDSTTSIQNNANIVTRSGADIAPFNGKTVSFVRDGSVWRQVN